MNTVGTVTSNTIYTFGACPICGKSYEDAEQIDSWWEDGYFYKEYNCPHCGAGISEEYELRYCSTSGMLDTEEIA
jgi:endogenous inhibitor of DNA gyrase (YacG/DUF329 family)